MRSHLCLLVVVVAACAGAENVTDAPSPGDDGASTTTNSASSAVNSSASASSGGTGGMASGGTSSSGSGGDYSGGASSAGGAGVGGAANTSSASTTTTTSASTTATATTGSGGSTGTDACGISCVGALWFEIDYTNAATATNPAWAFSPTAGWGEAQWAPNNSSWPEVWDVYNNINVPSDPIGTVAAVGPSGTLQVMLGIQGVTSYSKAVVCVEGRSISTSSSVTFDVYNPLNNCGATASMAHDWTVHAVALDLGNCLIPNNNFQAVRIVTSGGSGALGITRLRLTLQNAVY